MHSSDVLKNEVFGTQPTMENIKSQIGDLMEQYGTRVEKLTANTLDPTKRAIVDKRLLELQMKIGILENHHKERMYNILTGELSLQDAPATNDEGYGNDAMAA